MVSLVFAVATMLIPPITSVFVLNLAADNLQSSYQSVIEAEVLSTNGDVNSAVLKEEEKLAKMAEENRIRLEGNIYRPKLNALGFFTLGIEHVGSITGTILTFFVFLWQFQQSYSL